MLDSYALLAFLFEESGHHKVVSRLDRALAEDRPALVASPTWAEVRSMVERRLGAARWPEARRVLLGLPIDIVAADQSLAEAAGELKATKPMSLADCFAAALARQRGADIYTGDPEFKAVQKDIKIVWL